MRNDNDENFASIGALMVSKKVVDEKLKALFMYREKPMNPQDSGWRIFSGFESQEYTDNSENTGIYAPSTILKLNPSIEKILLMPRGTVWERKNGNSEWYKVDDCREPQF